MLVHSVTMMLPWTISQISRITRLNTLGDAGQPSLEGLLQLTRLTCLEAGGFSKSSFEDVLRALTNLKSLRCELTERGDYGAMCRLIKTCSIPNVVVSWRPAWTSPVSYNVVLLFVKLKGELEMVTVDAEDMDWTRGMDVVPALGGSGYDGFNLPCMAGNQTHSLTWYFVCGLCGGTQVLSSLTALRSLELTFVGCLEVPSPMSVTGLTNLRLSSVGYTEQSIQFMSDLMASNCSTLRRLDMSLQCWTDDSMIYVHLTKLKLQVQRQPTFDLSRIFRSTPVVCDLSMCTVDSVSVQAVTCLSGLKSLELDLTGLGQYVHGTLDLVAGMSGLTTLTLMVHTMGPTDCRALKTSRATLHLKCYGGRVPEELTVLTNLRSLTGGVTIVSPDVLIGCVNLESVDVSVQENTHDPTNSTVCQRLLEGQGICARVSPV